MVDGGLGSLKPQGTVLFHCHSKSLQGWEEELRRSSCIAIIIPKDGQAPSRRQLVVESLDIGVDGATEERASVRLPLCLALTSISPLFTSCY